MPHQRPGVEQLRDLRVGALWWEPGVGKTRAMIDLIWQRQRHLSRVVWFAPVPARLTICNEWLKHTDLPPEQVYTFDHRTRPGSLPQASVYIIGSESLSGSDRVALAAYALMDDRTLIVFDESDQFRSIDALRFQRAEVFARQVGHRFLLSGTAVNEGAKDAYGQMRLLDPAILGYRSWYAFSAAHLVLDEEFQGRVAREKNTELLTRRMAPYVSRVAKSELHDLPPKLYDSHWFKLTPEQERAYEQAKDELLPISDDREPTLYDIRRLFTALQTIAAGYWNRRTRDALGREYVGHLTFPHHRLDLLGHALSGLPDDEQVLVWCKYGRSVEQVTAWLREHYPDEDVAEYHGEVPQSERAAQLGRFQGGTARFLVGTPGTGGRGLNELVGAKYAVFYETGYKARERVQAEDRLNRLTSTHSATIIDLIADCPIERSIHDALARKEDASTLLLREIQKAWRGGGKKEAQRVLGGV